jgi:hypothetical protein
MKRCGAQIVKSEDGVSVAVVSSICCLSDLWRMESAVLIDDEIFDSVMRLGVRR